MMRFTPLFCVTYLQSTEKIMIGKFDAVKSGNDHEKLRARAKKSDLVQLEQKE